MGSLLKIVGGWLGKTGRLVYLVIILMLIAGAYFIGRSHGQNSCPQIDPEVIEEKIAVSQSASRNTAKFALDQQEAAQNATQQLQELEDESIDQTMPSDFIDKLNF